MLFENCENTKKQGDLGEARAIYEYAKLGYVVCAPLCDSAKYDLIVEKDGETKRVQVKTVSNKTNGGFEVQLANKSCNTIRTSITARKQGDYDELFVLTGDDRCWMIPSIEMGGCKYGIKIGHTKWGEFELS